VGLVGPAFSVLAMKSFDVAAVVSGGASGLGEATVRELAARGAAVTILDLQEERGRALADELGGHTTFVRTDVTDEASVQAAIDEATGKDRPLRIAINCAGIGWAQRTVGRDNKPHDLEPFVKTVMVNLIGTFNVLRLAAAAMAATEPLEDGERGVVVSTASIAAYDGQIGQIAYSASKGGIVGMTLPAARDLSTVGIRVCTIAPGLVDTPLLGGLPEEARQALSAGIPFPKRLGRPADFAELALDIVEHGYLNGEVIRMDGALRMAPR
jgi:NAD(P)-dependent dehydrogenase (short-subunit alcohol dehydrogenase family)